MTDSELRSLIAQNAIAIQQNNAAIDRVVATQAGIQQSFQNLLQLVAKVIEEGAEDRRAIREMQAEIRGIQVENQRILEYLFGMQRGIG